MPIIADAGGPSISENPDELLTKYEADNKFILD
jgi:hypothetical protein